MHKPSRFNIYFLSTPAIARLQPSDNYYKASGRLNTKTLNILAINIYICYMYAIVDIETTGGHASANGITEIAICIHDGKKVVKRFQSLVNPHKEIPIYISALTGISDEMVQDAP